jgi:hypothetical protein
MSQSHQHITDPRHPNEYRYVWHTPQMHRLNASLDTAAGGGSDSDGYDPAERITGPGV